MLILYGTIGMPWCMNAGNSPSRFPFPELEDTYVSFSASYLRIGKTVLDAAKADAPRFHLQSEDLLDPRLKPECRDSLSGNDVDPSPEMSGLNLPSFHRGE
jgi:hypothetical protein